MSTGHPDGDLLNVQALLLKIPLVVLVALYLLSIGSCSLLALFTGSAFDIDLLGAFWVVLELPRSSLHVLHGQHFTSSISIDFIKLPGPAHTPRPSSCLPAMLPSP